jgi:hypothetical protein
MTAAPMRRPALAALTVAIAIAATATSAQSPGGGAGPGRGGGFGSGARGGGPMEMAAGPSSVAEIVTLRLTTLEEDLRLTPAQRPAWNAYSNRVTRLLSDTARTGETTLTGDLTGPQRLDRLADVARNRLTAIEDIVEAGKVLYGVLTPEQKAIADNRLATTVLPMLSGGAGVSGGRGPRPPR